MSLHVTTGLPFSIAEVEPENEVIEEFTSTLVHDNLPTSVNNNIGNGMQGKFRNRTAKILKNWSQTYIKWLITGTCTIPKKFFKTIQTEFCCGLMLAMMSQYLLVKGLMNALIQNASTPIFREHLHLPADVHNIATSISMLPWSIKGIVGTVSDVWPIWGYHKRTYMLFSCVFGLIGGIILVVFNSSLTVTSAIIGTCLVMIQVSFNDLLCEGAYTREMAKKPHTGASMTSFVWLCSSVGTFLAALWVGPVVDNYGFITLLFPLIPASLQQLFCVLCPWPFVKWSKSSGLIQEEYNKTYSLEHWRSFMVALSLVVLAIGSMVAGLFSTENHVVGFGYSLGAAFVLIILVIYAMPKALYKPVLYLFLSRVLIPGIGSHIVYWLRADKTFVPDGPEFSWTFLLTWTPIAQAIFQIVAAALFQLFVSKWHFHWAFSITSILQITTSVFDLALINRWNITVFHISDKIWYFLSAGIIEEVVYMWAFMPSVVLTSRLCPKNIEATTYAIVAGVSNFGHALSKYLGNYLATGLLHIQSLTQGDKQCDFRNLPLAVIIANGLCPLVPLILTYFLVPRIKMDVHFVDDLYEASARQEDGAGAGGAAGTEEPPINVCETSLESRPLAASLGEKAPCAPSPFILVEIHCESGETEYKKLTCYESSSSQHVNVGFSHAGQSDPAVSTATADVTMVENADESKLIAESSVNAYLQNRNKYSTSAYPHYINSNNFVYLVMWKITTLNIRQSGKMKNREWP